MRCGRCVANQITPRLCKRKSCKHYGSSTLDVRRGTRGNNSCARRHNPRPAAEWAFLQGQATEGELIWLWNCPHHHRLQCGQSIYLAPICVSSRKRWCRTVEKILPLANLTTTEDWTQTNVLVSRYTNHWDTVATNCLLTFPFLQLSDMLLQLLQSELVVTHSAFIVFVDTPTLLDGYCVDFKSVILK